MYPAKVELGVLGSTQTNSWNVGVCDVYALEGYLLSQSVHHELSIQGETCMGKRCISGLERPSQIYHPQKQTTSVES